MSGCFAFRAANSIGCGLDLKRIPGSMFVKVTVPDVFSEKSKRLKHFKKAKAPNSQNLTEVKEMEPSNE